MNWYSPIRWRGFIIQSDIAQLPPISKAEIAKMPMAEVIETTQILQSIPSDVRTTEQELINLADLPIGDFTQPQTNRNDAWKEGVEEYIVESGGELVKDAIGFGLITIGSWLAAPDAFAGPVDEIIGIGLIWTGRFIMWV